MNSLAPLWAQIPGELIGIAIMILVFVVPAILQMLNKKKEPQRPPGARRPAGRPAGQPAAGNVEDEIGEFLRRAAQRRGGREAPPPPPAPRQAPPPVMAQVVGGGPDEVEPVSEVPVGDQVREHVAEYLDTGKFDRRADELGDEVAQADEQLDQRLQQVFGHDVSKLARKPGESASAPGVAEAEEPEDRVAELPSTAAAGLPVLLSTSENIRQAIIVNEILTRPEDRWV